MRKKILFYAFVLFVMLFTLVAWSYAKVELVEIQEKSEVNMETKSGVDF